MEKFIGPFDLLPPVIEDPGFADAACQPVFIDDEGVVIADAQARALLDAEPGVSLMTGPSWKARQG